METQMANDLISAAQKGDIDIVRILLDNGANINFKDNYGDTALMWASIEGHTDIVQLLLDMGANLYLQNNHGTTAILLASSNGNTDVVELLLDRGANPNIQNNNGNTALILASFYGNTDIVNLLNRHKAYSKIQSRFRGRRTRKKIRTLKAKQRSSLAKLQDSIQGMTGKDLDPDIYKNISELISNMPYNPEVSRRMLEEEQDEQDDPYTEWLQDRRQLGSGQRSNRSNRRKNINLRKII